MQHRFLGAVPADRTGGEVVAPLSLHTEEGGEPKQRKNHIAKKGPNSGFWKCAGTFTPADFPKNAHILTAENKPKERYFRTSIFAPKNRCANVKRRIYTKQLNLNVICRI